MPRKRGAPAGGAVAAATTLRIPQRRVFSWNALRRLLDRLLVPEPPTRRELAICAGLLTLLAALAFGSHVANGGFLMDDWSNAAKSKYLASCCGLGQTGQGIGWGPQFTNMLHDGPAAYHLGLPVVVPVAYFLFGTHMSLHIALAVALGVAMSWVAYVLMRRLGLVALHAGLICALVLVYPWSDSTRLWAMAGFNQIAVILWLGGLLVALRGLRVRGRSALAWHAGALAMYVLATLMYELAAGLVLFSVFFYLFRGSWRQALARWLPDIAVAYLSLEFVRDHTVPRAVQPFDAALAHANTIGGQALTVLGRTAIPFGSPPRILTLGLMLLAFVLAGARLLSLPPGDALRASLRRWLVVGLAGLVMVVAGYLTIVPATYGAPLDAGVENRVNMIAAFGYVAIVYAAAAILGTLAVRRLNAQPRLALALPLTLVVVMCGGFLARIGDDTRNYDDAFAQGQAVIGGIARAYAPNGPPAASTTYVFGVASFTAPGVPVFAWVWDLPGAMKVSFNDPSLAAFPILPGTSWQCDERSMFPISEFGTGPAETGGYGMSYFVDAATGVKERIDSKAECEAAQRRFIPAPIKRGEDCTLLGGGPATRLSWLCEAEPRS